MKLYRKLLILVLFLVTRNMFCQSPIEIVFTDDFTCDTSWIVSDINLELKKGEGSIWFSGDYLGLSNATFITSFEDFTFHVDSINLDVENLCPSGFDLILYKTGEEPLHIIPPLHQSIQTIINPWTENPDSLTMWSCEGSIKTELVYCSFVSGDINHHKDGNIIVFPNPSSDRIKFNNILPNTNMSIYSLNGDHLICKQKIDNNCEIDISFLDNGLYIFEVEQPNNTQLIKFIKLTE